MAYWGAREVEDDTELDDGAMIRSVVKAFARYGCCLEPCWPFDESLLFQRPSNAAYAQGEAVRARVGSYARVTDLTGVKVALALGLPVIFGFAVPEYFESEEVASTGWVRMVQPDERVLGGHAVVAVGYDDRPSKSAPNKFIWVRNSWGAEWGQHGYFRMDQEFFTDPRRLVDDLWTIHPRRTEKE